MRTKIKRYQYTLPAHIVTGLINWDESGLNENDMAAIDALCFDVVNEHGIGHWVMINDIAIAHFCHNHDMRKYGILPCDCYDLHYVVIS